MAAEEVAASQATVVLMTHGDEDDIVPRSRVERSKNLLSQHGDPPSGHIGKRCRWYMQYEGTSIEIHVQKSFERGPTLFLNLRFLTDLLM